MVRSRGFAWLLVSLSSLALAAPLQAVITPGGDVDPIDSSWWTGGGDGSVDAYIGKTAAGSVIVDLGSDLSSKYGYIGYYSGSTGSVTVDGGGSTWTSGNLNVGRYGQGTLDITNGGAVSNTNGYIGYYSGSTGAVTVAGIGSTWTNSSVLYVGNSGHGTLNITNGGAVSNAGGYIGGQSSSIGIVTVDGSDSTWANSSYLVVGSYGHGTLDITNGGTVSNAGGYIGYGATGTVTVSGSNSTWINSGSFFVGGSDYYVGGPGELTVGNGGSVEVGGRLTIWGPGTLNVGATGKVSIGGSLLLAQDSTLTAEAGAAIHMTGSAFQNFQNESTNPANLAGLGNVTMIFEGGVAVVDLFEAAGEDMGAVLAGLDSNFALGTLQLGGADIGQIQLVDTFDNQPGWVGDEAVYVANLILGAGSTLDLNGLNLYYYNGLIDPAATVVGTVIELPGIGGDANRDMAVDVSDLGILADNYGTSSGATWAMGDFNDDGAVDISDLGILAGSYGLAGGGAVPEPATLVLLAAGAAAVLTRRRRQPTSQPT